MVGVKARHLKARPRVFGPKHTYTQLELDYEKKHRDSQGEVIQAQKLTAKSQDVAMTATQEVNAQVRGSCGPPFKPPG